MPRILCCLFALTLASFLVSGCESAKREPAVTINGHTFYVELATTPSQREKGLMGRTQMGDNQGMLFMYPSARVMDFWMRNCLMPIDVAFIGPDMKIVKICRMQVYADPAQGNKGYSSVKPAQFALEVRGGRLDACGITEGQTVQFSPEVPPASKTLEDPPHLSPAAKE